MPSSSGKKEKKGGLKKDASTLLAPRPRAAFVLRLGARPAADGAITRAQAEPQPSTCAAHGARAPSERREAAPPRTTPCRRVYAPCAGRAPAAHVALTSA